MGFGSGRCRFHLASAVHSQNGATAIPAKNTRPLLPFCPRKAWRRRRLCCVRRAGWLAGWLDGCMAAFGWESTSPRVFCECWKRRPKKNTVPLESIFAFILTFLRHAILNAICLQEIRQGTNSTGLNLIISTWLRSPQSARANPALLLGLLGTILANIKHLHSTPDTALTCLLRRHCAPVAIEWQSAENWRLCLVLSCPRLPPRLHPRLLDQTPPRFHPRLPEDGFCRHFAFKPLLPHPPFFHPSYFCISQY